MDTIESLLTALKSNGGSVTTTKKKQGIEEEQAFVILSDNVKKVIQGLATFQKIGQYAVGKGELIDIEDTFYDFPDGLIREGKFSLRVRIENGTPLVTLKGKNESKDGSSKRSELEVEWPWTGAGVPSPSDVALLFGMEAIQRRETTRIARPIIRKFDQVKIAELAIDTVVYDFGKGSSAKTYEVEIEMKSNKGLTLSNLKKDLISLFPELYPWDQSKFAMGKVLEFVSGIEHDEDGFLTGSSFWALSNLKVA